MLTRDFVNKKIEQAKKKHNNFYTYEWLETHIPDSAKSHIIVHCPEHGDFQTTIDNHINNGTRCPYCAGRPTRTQEELRKICEDKAKERGKNYSFENTVFGKMNDEIEIFCNEKDVFGNVHGIFKRALHSYLKGCACPKCSRPYINCTQEEYIAKAEEVHGKGRYDYSKLKYTGKYNDEGVFICHEKDEFGDEHGEFRQKFLAHINGSGCPKCSKRGKLTKEDFVKRANSIHKGKYTYENFIYVDAKTKGLITCPLHGDFLQVPDAHLAGCGCPKCRSSKMEKKLASMFDTHNIYYEEQVHYPGLSYQAIDLFLPQHKLAIECQGEQHWLPSKFTQTVTDEEAGKDLNHRIELDKRKYDILTDAGYTVVYYTEPNRFINKEVDVYAGWYADKRIFTNQFDLLDFVSTLPTYEYTPKEMVVKKKKEVKRIQRKPRKWTYELLKEEAAKYSSRREFYKKDSGAYSTALRNGWLDDFFEKVQMPYGYWNDKSNVIDAASKCKSAIEFIENYGGAYFAARKHGWMDELFPNEHAKKGYWTKERVIEEAKKYKTITEMHKNSSSAFNAGYKNGWLEGLFESDARPKGYWNNKENVLKAASECRNADELQEKYGGCYSSAKKHKWLKDLIYKK